MQMQPNQNSRQIQSYVFGAILILLFIAVCSLFSSFFTVLLWSVLLYIMLSPLHRRIVRNLDLTTLKGKILRKIWAGVFAVGTMIIILLPFLFIVFLFLGQAIELRNQITEFMDTNPNYNDILNNISGFIRNISGGHIEISNENIKQQIMSFIGPGLQYSVTLSRNIAMYIGNFLVSIMLMVFTLFFLYIDGQYLSRLLLNAIPIKQEYISTLSAKFLDITRNLFLGYIIVAFLQAILAYIIFIIFGINGALVLAVLTFFLVFIPIIGAGILYVPLGIYLIAEGNTTGGILFLIVCTIFLFGLDSILRPMFLKDRINLHPLIIFFAILGGLVVFGFNGFILGPVLVLLFLTVLDLFLIEHKINDSEQQNTEDTNN